MRDATKLRATVNRVRADRFPDLSQELVDAVLDIELAGHDHDVAVGKIRKAIEAATAAKETGDASS